MVKPRDRWTKVKPMGGRAEVELRDPLAKGSGETIHNKGDKVLDDENLRLDSTSDDSVLRLTSYDLELGLTNDGRLGTGCDHW